jgi:hypothetical protein
MTASGSSATSALSPSPSASPSPSPSTSPWIARLLCVPLFLGYALLLAFAVGARPTLSDGMFWTAWLFVGVIAPLAALCGVLLLGLRIIRNGAHRSMVDVGLCGLTMLALIVQMWLVTPS